MRRKAGDDRGVTLVELLLVIAILSIVTGAFAISISLINSRDAEKCAKHIDSAMESTRMNSLSQTGEFFLELDADNHILVITSSPGGTVVETIDLPKKVTITVEAYKDSATAAGSKLKLSFDKSVGGVKKLFIDGMEVGKDNWHTLQVSAVTEGSGKKALVTLVRMTGKHYVY